MNVEQLRFVAHSDQCAALSSELRESVSADLWELISAYACSVVTFVRLGAEMARAYDRSQFRERFRFPTRATRPVGLCCAIRRDGVPCNTPARYTHADGSLTCGNHKRR